MKIEVGRFYKGVTGRKYMVLEILDSLNNITVTTKSINDPRIWNTATVNSSYLLSEWVDKPTIDRKNLPAWFKWAAMDESGNWFAYKPKPSKIGKIWTTRHNADLLEIPQEYAPKWTGKFEDSLIELDNQTV